MINVLIISNNDSINKLIDHFQPLILGKIDLAENFDRGLKMVFDKRPIAVFIQSELAGVSGETVSRHIKGLLGSKSPNIILLKENTSAKASAGTFFDDTMELFLPDNQLIEAFRVQLDKIPGLFWKEPLQAGTGVTVHEREAFPSSDKSGVTTADALETPSRQATRSSAASHLDEGKDVPTLAALEKAALEKIVIGSNAKEGDFYTTGGKHPAVVQKDTSSLPFELGMFDKVEQSFKTRHKQNRKHWLYFLALFIAVGLGMLAYFNFPRTISVFRKRQPAVSAQTPGHSTPLATLQTQTASPGQTVKSIHLPSFIPLQAVDTAYSRMHPGWVRYYDQQREFLVFSEKGAIKAVQIIACKEGGINGDFFSSALKELCGVETLKVTARREKDGYDVEEGKIGDNLEFILYKKLHTGIVMAFVVSLPR